jgi:hypothetical protein
MKKNKLPTTTVETSQPPVPTSPLEEIISPVVSPQLPTKISDSDLSALNLLKEKKLTAEGEVELAKAKLANVELSFQYLVLNLYVKYELSTTKDALSPTGEILRGGANK